MPLAIPAAAFDLLGFGARLPDTDPEVTFSSCHLSASFPFEEPVESDEECAPPSGFPAIDVLMAFSGKTDVSSSESHIDVIIVAHSGRRPIFASCQTVRYDINSENGRLENPIIIGGNTLVYKSVPTLSNIWSGSCRWALINDFPTTRPYSLIEGFATYLSGLPFPDANDCFNGTTSDPCENRDPGLYALATVAATNDLIGDFSWTIETKVDLPFKISCEAIPANVLDLAEWSLNTFVDSLVDDVSSFLAGKAEDIVFRLFKRVFTFATGGLSNAVLKLTAEVLVDGVVTEVEDALSIDVSLLCCPGDEPELPDADGREYPPPTEYTVTLPRTSLPAKVIPNTVVRYLEGRNCSQFESQLSISGSTAGARNPIPSTMGLRTFMSSSLNNSMRYQHFQFEDSEGRTDTDYYFAYVTIDGVERRYDIWLRQSGEPWVSNWLESSGWFYTPSDWFVANEVGTEQIQVRAGCTGYLSKYGPKVFIFRNTGPDLIVRDSNGRLIKVENPPEGNPPPSYGNPPEIPQGSPDSDPNGTKYRVSVGISIDIVPFIRKRPVLTDSTRRLGIPGTNQSPFGNAIEAIEGLTDLFNVDVGQIPLFEVCTTLPGSDLIAELINEFSGDVIPGIGPVSPDIRIEEIGPCHSSD